MISERIWRDSSRGGLPPDARHVQRLFMLHQRGQRAAVLDLDLLRFRSRRPEADGDVVRQMVAADGKHLGMPQAAFEKERHIRRPAADVHHHHAQVLLLRGQHGPARGKRLEHEVIHVKTGAGAALHDVLDRGERAGDDMHLRFEPDRRTCPAGP